MELKDFDFADDVRRMFTSIAEANLIYAFEDRSYLCMIMKCTGDDCEGITSWYCGYVGLPKGSKFDGITKTADCDELDVHGKITYCRNKFPIKPKLDTPYSWVIGYDTNHRGDRNRRIQTKKYQTRELRKLVDQLSGVQA